MFERYTERARQVVVLAQDEARGLKHSYIGTEHILLGLLREAESVGCEALEKLGVEVDEVRRKVGVIVGLGDVTPMGQIPFTPRAKKVLEFSLREALSLGHNYVGTEHILLGLVRENEGVAARILLDFDADAEKIRNEVIRILSGRRPARRPIRTGSVAHATGSVAHVIPELLAKEHAGLVKADAKHKRRIHRLERVLVDHVDKNGRLKYELRRLEEALLEIYKNPEHAQDIVHRTIPKKVYKHNLDPGKKPEKKRKSKRS